MYSEYYIGTYCVNAVGEVGYKRACFMLYDEYNIYTEMSGNTGLIIFIIANNFTIITGQRRMHVLCAFIRLLYTHR